MARDGTSTRNEILDAAQRLFLSQGYAGTSVDAILEQTGVTKGAFFHHFESKHDLARALIERYARSDGELLVANLERAERLSRDPLQQVLILVGLYEESMEELEAPAVGCLFASYCYQAGLFDDEIREVVRESMRQWRDMVAPRLRSAMERYPPRMPVDADELADVGLAIVEGAFVLSRTLGDPKLVAGQFRHYRNYLEMLFGVT